MCAPDQCDGVQITWKREYLVLRKQTVTATVPRELVDNLDLDDGAMVLDEWICSHVPERYWQEVEEGIDNDDLEYGLADGEIWSAP
jgi:hypothetical protein